MSIAGNSPAYADLVRQRMVDLIGTLWATPMPVNIDDLPIPDGSITL